MTFKSLLLGSALALGSASLMSACNKEPAITEAPAPVNAKLGSFGIALENIDETVKPGDDFFRYVNGKWLDNTEIPADRSSYGSFHILADQAELRVRDIIESAAETGGNAGSAEQRIGDLFSSFMDADNIETKGMAPLQADLDAIYALGSHEDIALAFADRSNDLTLPFGPYVYIDSKDTTQYITYMGQGGLALPDRSYYLDDKPSNIEIRAAYLDYMTTVFEAAGKDNPRERAENVLAFETDIARAHWTREKRRERDLTYNKMTMEELDSYAPGLPWAEMMKLMNIGDIDDIVLTQNTAVKDSAKVVVATPVPVLQDYMAFHLINDYSQYLPSKVDNASFDFFGTALRGTKEQRPRWKRGVSFVNGTVGELVGKIYVQDHFPESSKAQMQDLVENLRAVFKEGIDDLEWMSEDTKTQAQYKLAKFNPKIGYPDKWEDYDGLNVDKDDLIGTVKSARLWRWNDRVGKLGQPIDRDVWGMTPQTVNAYYNSSLNEIVFPAAILDAPFFDPNADPAVNYGGIGAVIGHEMGHGFDDQGRKTTGDGMLEDWWTEQDAENFKARASRLGTQYDAFEPLPGEFVNGTMTMGENIGDLTGITMAYKAYKRSLGGQEAPMIDGLTGDQRFFLAYAQIWQAKYLEKAALSRLKTDVHSPGQYRANGIVRNFDPWYEAFNITTEDELYLPPEERVRIWE
ncbi:M13 family metallopeptidase [Robiginitomaculum antarcticum]|uniref:M13 family metallopeptidase n=1 Tax=Robiginitomaculum antarcticum TaxID=437507 RepID=UPI0003683E0C|nr:M13 family metallopeptidase [Robiginitomaculum antarcticum]